MGRTHAKAILLLAALVLGLLPTSASSQIMLPSGQKVFQLTQGENRVPADYGCGGELLAGTAQVPFPEPPSPYPPNFGDGVSANERSYVVPGLAPFSMKYFTNEFSYGGWHTWNMTDYAATRGFRYLSKYWKRPPIKELPYLPQETQWLHWGGFNWEQWLEKRTGDPGRYDYLSGREFTEADFENAFFLSDPAENHLMMIDMEHGVLPPEQLRAAPFYPKDKTPAQQDAFEGSYYDGYARTYTLPVEMAHKKGWKVVGLYGWAPFGRQWGGLEKMQTLSENAKAPWELYGKKIYDAVDVIYPSVYCFYWTPQNTAYILANIDANMAIVNAQKTKKPVRPYFWTLLHGGGGGWRWWQGQPLRNEEVEAQVALSFFTGEDGIVEWNWAGTGNHIARPTVYGEKDYRFEQQMGKYRQALARYEATKKGTPPKPPAEPGFNFQIGVPFTAKGADASKNPAAHDFQRYDHIHVLEVTPKDVCLFQPVLLSKAKNYGKDPSYPVYQMPRADLEAKLRPLAEPVGSVFRALALVHRYEDFFKNGEVRIDCPAYIQFRDKPFDKLRAVSMVEPLPIVRRVRYGNYHLVATYDPSSDPNQAGRDVTIRDFDGRPGVYVTLPSAGEVKLFLLRLDSAKSSRP